MAIEVLDASALVAYIKKEDGAIVVESLLDDPGSTCFAHSVNLCEVYYEVIRELSGEPTASQTIADLFAAGVIEADDMDRSFWQSVGQLKAGGRISLADCFCIALAIRVGGRVVTSDHHEFDRLVPLRLCPILFIR